MDIKFIIKCVVIILLLGGMLALAGTSLSLVADTWTDFLAFFSELLIVSATRLGGIAQSIIACEPLFRLIGVSFCIALLALLCRWFFTGKTTTIK